MTVSLSQWFVSSLPIPGSTYDFPSSMAIFLPYMYDVTCQLKGTCSIKSSTRFDSDGE